MNPEHHRRLTARFLHAVRLPADGRPPFLERLRAEDAVLGAEVESLLAHDARLPAILRDGIVSRDELLSPVDAVGPYRLAERIGEGGMGVVYRAEQVEPIEREVAIKLIRAGFETARVLARFESERRVLARMDHPNIARVVDAGTTTDGRPYVAMEYVRGVSITAFCDQQRLDVVERLRLFLQVCDAIHYAHQNAIIHRDLKPSNVLVTVVDGRPMPKIIDFGIAKALHGDGAPDATLTEAGQLLGTPAYMSPEQASIGESNPDTRSDVYSLGVLLYELLVGRTPLDLPSGDAGGPDEVRRVIRESEPLAPSARVAGLVDRAPEIAARRRADPAALVRRLRGDLDAIAGMALDKKRERRYGSAAELAADVRRHLGHEPIHARPPSLAYRVGKLVRRHRTGTAVVLTLVPALAISAVLLVFLAQRLARERDRAEEVSELLVRAYETPFQYLTRGTLRDPVDVLSGSRRRVEAELGDRPVLQARMLASIGEAIRIAGDSATALRILADASPRLTNELGLDDPRTFAARHALGRAYADRHERAAAEKELAGVLDSRRRILGDDHPDTLRTMSDLALLYREMKQDREAAELLEAVMSAIPRVLGETHDETLVNASLLAAVYLDLERIDDAERMLRAYLPRMPRALRERSKALYNMASVHALRGERRLALDRLRESVEAGFLIGYFADPHLRSLFDDPEFLQIYHYGTMRTSNELWRVHFAARHRAANGELDEAEALYRDLLASFPREASASRASAQRELAHLLIARARYAEALPLLEEAARALRGEPGRDHERAVSTWYLVQARLGAGRRVSALRLLEDEIRELREGPGRLAAGGLRHLEARRAGIVGDHSEALRSLRSALDLGYVNAELVREDLAFLGIRDTPEFRSIVAEMDRRTVPPARAGIRGIRLP